MRHATKIYVLVALAAVLTVVAWGCSTDSPTAPTQTPPPPPTPPNQSNDIQFSVDPRGIAVPTTPTGQERAAITVRVRNPIPPDGTSILLTTNIGQFDAATAVRTLAVELVNGDGFFTLFGGPPPVQFGVATVQGELDGEVGQVKVPIVLLEADFSFTNPENNTSVDFQDISSGNPQQFLWEFGDGGRSTQRNPTHDFPSGGTFPVKLTVSRMVAGVKVSDDVRKSVTVVVEVEEP